MTRFLQTLAWSLAATFVVALFLPDSLLVALVLAIGRATDRRLKTVVAQAPFPQCSLDVGGAFSRTGDSRLAAAW